MELDRKKTIISNVWGMVDDHYFAPIFNEEDRDEDGESGVTTVVKSRTKRPPLYKVLLHNDDYTTMEFVVDILRTVFGMDSQKAQVVMLKIHNEGFGVCGVYTFEIAETKMAKVAQMAREHGHPLKCTIEEE